MDCTRRRAFLEGLRSGLPIALGYAPVSFAFAVSAAGSLPWPVVLLITVTNFSGAGQAAGTGLLIGGASLPEIGVTMLIVNLRYVLMSLSLSQRIGKLSIGKRLLLACGITDEIYFLAMQRPGRISGWFYAGLTVGPYAGWVSGTVAGLLIGAVIPPVLSSALGIALYAMLIAIIVPPARASRPIAFAVLTAVGLSCVLRFVPGIRHLPAGWSLILAAVAAALLAGWRYPIRMEEATQT